MLNYSVNQSFRSKRGVLSLFITLLLVLVFGVHACKNDAGTQRTHMETVVPDSTITNTINRQLANADDVNAENITVESKEGIVTLRGNISNLLAKRSAEQRATTVRGVRSVVNNLAITTDRRDQVLQDDVLAALNADPATEPYEVTASVNNGTVRLKGAVDSWHEHQLAERVAAGVKGVIDITNNITIDYSGARNEENIKAEVQKILKWSSQIDDKMIDVAVDNNKVVLNGSVGSARELQLAREEAHVAGVDEVITKNLHVRPELKSSMIRTTMPDNVSDQAIEEAVLDAWQYDPRVKNFDLKVAVSDNVATLRGKVDNLSSKLSAAEDARNTVGVDRVINNISVDDKIVVRPKISVEDDAIEERIKYAFSRDPYVDATQIEVKVNDGIATLEGTVGSEFLERQAIEIVNSTIGILSVDNELKVQSNQNAT